MSEDKTYNGWTNYETWCVSLWIDNDEGMYYQAQEMAQNVADQVADGSVSREDGRYGLGHELRDWIDEVAEMTCPGCREGASFVSDLLGAALSEVDWHEIAENKLDEALESVDA